MLLAQSPEKVGLRVFWPARGGPSPDKARHALRQITSNVYEPSWFTSDGKRLNVWQAVAINLGLLDFEDPTPEATIYRNDAVYS